jgi:hypothetical protein
MGRINGRKIGRRKERKKGRQEEAYNASANSSCNSPPWCISGLAFSANRPALLLLQDSVFAAEVVSPSPLLIISKLLWSLRVDFALKLKGYEKLVTLIFFHQQLP